ncbi:MAG: hypothetical protein CMJ64_09005, partial [Planctomycetaceae bacterium]|nr:hypothetical protein [Planctomycetaceae bacterium]
MVQRGSKFLNSFLRRQDRKRNRRGQRRPLFLESLEDRRLLAYSATLVGTVVTLVGDLLPDGLTIDQGGGGLLR